jgi:hypothetical protein
VISVDFNLVQHGDGIFREDGQATVQGDERGSDRLAVDAHKFYRQPHYPLALQAWLVETDDTLTLLSRTQQVHTAASIPNLDLVNVDQWQTAPG